MDGSQHRIRTAHRPNLYTAGGRHLFLNLRLPTLLPRRRGTVLENGFLSPRSSRETTYLHGGYAIYLSREHSKRFRAISSFSLYIQGIGEARSQSLTPYFKKQCWRYSLIGPGGCTVLTVPLWPDMDPVSEDMYGGKGRYM